MSILDVGGEFGTFDYVLCHGVYSWVPPEVQDKILRSAPTTSRRTDAVSVMDHLPSYSPDHHRRRAVPACRATRGHVQCFARGEIDDAGYRPGLFVPAPLRKLPSRFACPRSARCLFLTSPYIRVIMRMYGGCNGTWCAFSSGPR